jgi:WD40 repeat protein
VSTRVAAVLTLALLGAGVGLADSTWRRVVVDLRHLELLNVVEKKYTHCLSPGGNGFAVLDGNVVRLLDARDGRETQTLVGHDGKVHDSCWSRNGRLLATSGFDTTVRVWDTSTGKALLNVTPFGNFACSVAFSPDGKTVAAGSSNDGLLKIYDVATGKAVREIQSTDTTLYAMEYSPDGRFLAVNHTPMNRADSSLRVYKLADGSEQKLPIAGPVGGFAFSRNGTRMAYSDLNGGIGLVETAGWTELRRLEGHQGGISSLAFHPAGRYLASSGHDGSAKIWDAEKATLVISLPIKGQVDSRLAFGPDGETLIVATSDATVSRFGRREAVSAAAPPAPAGPAPNRGK